MKRRRILVIDDDETFRWVVRESLTKLGYEIREAATARDAKDRLAHGAPDLIILDIMMPDMDGITLCRDLRSTETTRSVPILIVSALDDREIIKEAFAVGASDYAVKPVNFANIQKKIDTLLRKPAHSSKPK